MRDDEYDVATATAKVSPASAEQAAESSDKVESIKAEDSALNRAEILAVDDSHHQRVRVPEWGEGRFVYMRAITSRERDAFDLWSFTNDGKNVRAHLVHLTICDEAGKPIFTVDDIDALGEKNGRVLDRLFDIASAMNGIGPAALAELEGN